MLTTSVAAVITYLRDSDATSPSWLLPFPPPPCDSFFSPPLSPSPSRSPFHGFGQRETNDGDKFVFFASPSHLPLTFLHLPLPFFVVVVSFSSPHFPLAPVTPPPPPSLPSLGGCRFPFASYDSFSEATTTKVYESVGGGWTSQPSLRLAIAFPLFSLTSSLFIALFLSIPSSPQP